MKKVLFLLPLLAMILTCSKAMAVTHTVKSPDGKLAVDVKLDEGKPSYEGLYEGVQMLMPSPWASAPMWATSPRACQ